MILPHLSHVIPGGGLVRPLIINEAPVVAPLPVFQALGTFAGSTIGLTVAWPTHIANDVGLLIVESASGEAVTLTNAQGFVAAASSPQDDGVAVILGTRLSCFWKRAAGAAEGSPIIADSGNHVVAGIITFRGCAPTGDPWNISAGNVLAAAATAVAVPGGTTTVVNCLVVAICTSAEDVAVARFSAWANAGLANVTERVDFFASGGNGGGIGVATGEKAVAGAFGDTTATLAGASTQARVMLALKG